MATTMAFTETFHINYITMTRDSQLFSKMLNVVFTVLFEGSIGLSHPFTVVEYARFLINVESLNRQYI
jgi:hypothetical protein